MTTRARHLIAGERAEDMALAHLEGAGLRLIKRRYRTRFGEIDLIMTDGPILVFVEVRYRADDYFGGSLASVDRHKRQRLIACASQFLAETREQRRARFDVVGVSKAEGRLNLAWIRDAFQT